jgi:hypothetical protein
MPLLINDPAAEALVRELVRTTGETIAEAVAVAVEERLARLYAPRHPRQLADELRT